MARALAEFQVLRNLTADAYLLALTRMVRRFAYGFLSVSLVLYLAQIGFSEQYIGVLLTLTLVGDAALSLWIATMADRLGRRRMLMIGAALMIFAGVLLGWSNHLLLLTLAVTIGTVSPSGGEVGPFLSIEQAALAQITSPQHRTHIFAWFNLAGSLATALGALAGGVLVQVLQQAGSTPLQSYRILLMAYALLGVLIGIACTRLSPAVEVIRNANKPVPGLLGLHRSRRVVFKLSSLFMLDAFGGGLVVESIISYWFHVRFGVEPGVLGGLFFGAHLFAGVSALVAARIAARIGLINTMVFTHLPSNILLIMVPLMPTLPLAMAVLLLRFCLSQMDVPTRESYTMAVVDADERSAAAGVTTVARTAARACAPLVTGALLGAALWSWPFFLAGGLKMLYDVSLYRSFRAIRPPEEHAQQG